MYAIIDYNKAVNKVHYENLIICLKDIELDENPGLGNVRRATTQSVTFGGTAKLVTYLFIIKYKWGQKSFLPTAMEEPDGGLTKWKGCQTY